MYPKFNLSRTRIVILTLVCTTVCAVAALVAFEQRPAQKVTLRPVDTMPRPNDASKTEVKRGVEGPVALRVEEASKPLKQETHRSLAAEKPTTASLINPFKLTPLSSNGRAPWLPEEKHPEQRRTPFSQSLNSPLDRPTTSAGIPDLSELVRAPLTARVAEPQSKREGRGEKEDRTDQPYEAARFRNMQMQDENGEVPIDGLQKARKQMDVMRARQKKQAQAAGKPDGLKVAGIGPGQWTSLGPGNVGGRIRSIVTHPTDPNKLWIGSVSGGIWQTPDGGAVWYPVNDFMANLAVSTMVMDPVNSNIMYAGTGETFARGAIVGTGFSPDGLRGSGIFKSTDGGVIWTRLESTNPAAPDGLCNVVGSPPCAESWFFVNRLAMSPDGSTILAATDNGIQQSTDGGATWTMRTTARVADVKFNPRDNNWASAGGFGSAHFSSDGGRCWDGQTWNGTLCLGPSPGAAFNQPIAGARVELAFAPSIALPGGAATIYASVNTNNGDIFRSVNGGQTFTLVNTGTNFFIGTSAGAGNQGGYDNIIWVNPQDPSFIVVGGIDLWRSTDSGQNFTQISQWQNAPATSAHADHHMIVAHSGFNNTTNKTVYFGNDGGIYRADDVSTVGQNNGWTVLNHGLGITQFYGAAGNSAGVIIGGTQDNGTQRFTDVAQPWTRMRGGDGGYAAADPTNNLYLYGEIQNMGLVRSTDGGETAGFMYCNPTPATGVACTGTGILDAFNGANFIAPFILDPNNSNTMLAGGLSLWRSDDIKASGLPTWAATKNPSPDNRPPTLGNNNPISAIAVSPNNPDFIVIGHNDGQIFLTFNGTNSPLPDWYPIDINNTVPSRFVTRLTIDETRSPNWIYATLGGFSANNVYVTKDLGTNWTDITGGATGLPDVPVRSLVINPVRRDFLYVGTEVGIFASEDAGATWGLTQDGPANVSVDELFWLQGSLVAATHGRGIYKSGTPVFGSNTCVPPIPACPCFGEWDCGCSWNLKRVPTENDDVALGCPMYLKSGVSSGGRVRNMSVYADLRMDLDIVAAGDVANFGNIHAGPGFQPILAARNLSNSRRPGNTGPLTGIIRVHQISATGNVTNAGLMTVTTKLESIDLTTAPDSGISADHVRVTGDLENYGRIEALGTAGIAVGGDIDNGGFLKAPNLGIFLTLHNFSGSGVWQFGAFAIPGGFGGPNQTVTLASDVTLDIADFYNGGTLDLRDRTLNFTGGRFQSVGGAVLGSGTFRFTPSSGSAIFASSTTNFTAGVTIASGTVEFQSGGSIGVLNVDPGTTLAMNGGSLTVNNDVVNNGAITRLSSSRFNFNGQTFTNNGSVGNIDFLTFNNSGAPKTQFIAGTGSWTPQNVNIGSGPPSTGTVTLQNDLTFGVTNQLMTSTGSALNTGGKTLTLTGPINFFAGKISGTGLVKLQPAGGTARITGPLTIDPELEIASGTIKGRLIIANGKLKIDSGATLSLYDFGVDASGDVENNGTINVFSDNPSLTFKGRTFTNNGVITGPVAVNFGNFLGGPFVQNLAGTGSWAGTPRLFIDSSSTTTLLNDVNYDGGNLYVEGRLNTGAFTLSLPCNVIWSGNGDVIGNVRRTNLATCPGAAIAFGSPFTTIQFTSGTTPTEITVNVGLAAPAGFPSAAGRTYLITPTGGSDYTATLRLHYLDSELNGNAESTLQLWRNNGSNWTPQGVTNRNTTQNWVEYNNVTQFSPWTISGPSAPTAPAAIISGRITTTGSTPLGGVLVSLNGSRSSRTITDSLGRYKFENVETGGFYTATPARANYSFSPPELSFSLLTDKTDAVFTAVPAAITANPLDTLEFFVRQQYLDFLNREPDQTGFEYWSNQLTHCGGDLTCIRNRRIDVSNAFFFELEFQQTGAYVFRLHRAAFGNNQPFPNPDTSHPAEARKLPSYPVFVSDRARVVGSAQLAASQLALASLLVQRAEFVARYPADLDGRSFIDAVLGTIGDDSGVDLTSERSALMTLFNSGGRAAVMYRLADDNAQTNTINNRAFIDAEYNRAFVFTQYAGYLRRNPDMAGFLFWLSQVNAASLRDVARQHAMVCAFITSAEYQLRFSSVVTHTNGECGP